MGEWFPLFLRDETAERLRLPGQRLTHGAERPPAERLVVRPGAREGALGRRQGTIELLAGGIGAVGEGRTRGRVDDREVPAPGDQLTVDQVMEGLHGESLPLGRRGPQGPAADVAARHPSPGALAL